MLRAAVAQRSHAGLEMDAGVARRLEQQQPVRVLRQVVAGAAVAEAVEVRVGVDQAGEDGRVGVIKRLHRSAVRRPYLLRCPHGADRRPLQEQRRALQGRSAAPVDQARGQDARQAGGSRPRRPPFVERRRRPGHAGVRFVASQTHRGVYQRWGPTPPRRPLSRCPVARLKVPDAHGPAAPPATALRRLAGGSRLLRPSAATRTCTGWSAPWRQPRLANSAVLRRYGPWHSLEDVAYELRVLDRMAALGWPVPPGAGLPRAASGATSGACSATSPAGRGGPAPPRPVRAELRARGRLLAALHADLATLTDLRQRPAWRRREELLDPWPGSPSVEDIIEARVAPEAPRSCSEYAAWVRARFAALGAARAPGDGHPRRPDRQQRPLLQGRPERSDRLRLHPPRPQGGGLRLDLARQVRRPRARLRGGDTPDGHRTRAARAGVLGDRARTRYAWSYSGAPRASAGAAAGGRSRTSGAAPT